MAKYKQIESEQESEKKRIEKLIAQQSKANVILNNPLKALEMIFNNEVQSSDIPTFSYFQNVRNVLAQNNCTYRLTFYNLIKHLIKQKAEILEHGSEFVTLLGLMCEYEIFFIRDITDWKKDSRNVNRQFKEIINHLFVKKKVPEFMYYVWNVRMSNHTYISWFIMMGAGESIKDEKGLPANYTKKMLHHFMNAPRDYNIPEALIYGRVKAFGGDERLSNTINASAIRSIRMNDFWDSVIKFFVDNPMLDSDYVTQIIDFLNHQKYHLETPRDADGKRLGPDVAAQPNLTMKGRTVDTLIRDSEEWHTFRIINQKRLEQERRIVQITGGSYGNSTLTWKRFGFVSEFGKSEGSLEKNNLTHYSIIEIISAVGLREEGAALGHCVGSYVGACSSGRSAIFSLRQKTHGFSERLVTIEINRGTMSIVQVRGNRNRAATKKEHLLITEWANRNELKLSRWI